MINRSLIEQRGAKRRGNNTTRRLLLDSFSRLHSSLRSHNFASLATYWHFAQENALSSFSCSTPVVTYFQFGSSDPPGDSTLPFLIYFLITPKTKINMTILLALGLKNALGGMAESRVVVVVVSMGRGRKVGARGAAVFDNTNTERGNCRRAWVC